MTSSTMPPGLPCCFHFGPDFGLGHCRHACGGHFIGNTEQPVGGLPLAQRVRQQTVKRFRCQQSRGLRGLGHGIGQLDLDFGHTVSIRIGAACRIIAIMPKRPRKRHAHRSRRHLRRAYHPLGHSAKSRKLWDIPNKVDHAVHISTRQYARLVDEWVTGIGLRREDYGTHSLRRTKASIIYKQTGNLRALQILLGHTKIESTVRYLGVGHRRRLGPRRGHGTIETCRTP